MTSLSGVSGYQSYPLAGSPAGRLRDDAAKALAAGLPPQCPHPGEPAFWYLPSGTLSCAECVGEFAGEGSGAGECQACGGPAAAVAAWVIGGIPCIAGLCEPCSSSGVVPLALN